MTRRIDCLLEDPRPRLSPEAVEACIAVIDRRAPFPPPHGDLAIAFVGEARCRELHGRFYGDPSVTDVMTFPGDPGDGHAGDIAICPAVAAGEAAARGGSFAEELTLYLVHGCLHLAGFRDGTPEEGAAMREAEAEVTGLLAAAGAPLPAEWHPTAANP